MSTCNKCGETKPTTDFYADKAKPSGHHSICKECVKADRKRRWREDKPTLQARNKAYYDTHRDDFYERSRALRRRVLEAYGGACKCCGETTPEFLAIDHVNNDGEAHRRELAGYGRSIYRWLSINGFPQDGRFQLLCHNCNMAKGAYGGCPHQGDVPGRRLKVVA